MLYTEYLTPSERMEAVRIGAVSAMAEAGLTPSGFDCVVKAAQASGGIKVPTVSLKDVANTAIIAGVPLGLMYYIVNRSLNRSDKKTRRLQKELDYYNDVSAELRNHYSDEGV